MHRVNNGIMDAIKLNYSNLVICFVLVSHSHFLIRARCYHYAFVGKYFCWNEMCHALFINGNIIHSWWRHVLWFLMHCKGTTIRMHRAKRYHHTHQLYYERIKNGCQTRKYRNQNYCDTWRMHIFHKNNLQIELCTRVYVIFNDG